MGVVELGATEANNLAALLPSELDALNQPIEEEDFRNDHMTKPRFEQKKQSVLTKSTSKTKKIDETNNRAGSAISVIEIQPDVKAAQNVGIKRVKLPNDPYLM